MVLLAIGVVLDYRNGVAPLNLAYDHALANAAHALASSVQGNAHGIALPEPGRALAKLEASATGYSSYYRVRRPADGAEIGDAGLPEAPGGHERVAYADLEYLGQALRVASYRVDGPAGRLVITVAESKHQRIGASWRIVGSLVLTDILQLGATVLLVLFGVRQGLRPLRQLRDEIARRSPSALGPLDPWSTPEEVRPVVEELNRLFATVRDSAAAQQRFLADAAHQIRTPLAGLRSRLDLLLRNAGDDTLREDLEALQLSVGRLTRTTHQLLALARADPTAGALLTGAPVALFTLSAEVVEGELDHAVSRGIDLGLEAEPLIIDGIAWLLRELLVNLLDNAIRYTPEGGRVTVRCFSRDGMAVLEVEDSGPGISLAERDRVCERFYRLPGTKESGCGLGLAIVAEVARIHGTRLMIAEGEGGAGARLSLAFAMETSGGKLAPSLS